MFLIGFLMDGFLASLNPMEILLYLFLVLASDRNGISFYAYDAICVNQRAIMTPL